MYHLSVDDRQLTPGVEKQRVAPTGKQGVVPLNESDSRMYLSHVKEGTHIIHVLSHAYVFVLVYIGLF